MRALPAAATVQGNLHAAASRKPVCGFHQAPHGDIMIHGVGDEVDLLDRDDHHVSVAVDNYLDWIRIAIGRR